MLSLLSARTEASSGVSDVTTVGMQNQTMTY